MNLETLQKLIELPGEVIDRLNEIKVDPTEETFDRLTKELVKARIQKGAMKSSKNSLSRILTTLSFSTFISLQR